MAIEKRAYPKYVLLNCLTLGVYGFIESKKIGKEINGLCKGDGEQPKFAYQGAVLFRGIAPFLGILTGLILGLIGTAALDLFDLLDFAGEFGIGFGSMLSGIKATALFLSMTICGVLFALVGSFVSGIYLNYWWYKQAERLKVNANRYGITVKESGVDTFLYRTLMQLVLLPITVVLYVLSCLLPLLIVWLLSLAGDAGIVTASILMFLFSIPLMFFGMELTAGANYSMLFIIKNLNRFSEAARNGGAQFDPMAYEYYPSIESKYPGFVPALIKGNVPSAGGFETVAEPSYVDESQTGVLRNTGSLIGIKGSCAGYNFELTSGEEIIVGKDAKVSMVVIDPAYKEISRKHVGVCYDVVRDQYRVIDYSSNGTWANGTRLSAGQEVYLPHGTELKLANDKNIFRLG